MFLFYLQFKDGTHGGLVAVDSGPNVDYTRRAKRAWCKQQGLTLKECKGRPIIKMMIKPDTLQTI